MFPNRRTPVWTWAWVWALLLALAPIARADDSAVCRAAAQYVEKKYGLPPQLLSAIAVTESGSRRTDAAGRKVFMAWPWTINVEGRGYFFPDKASAVARVRDLLARGQRSIDVGCMQVNLKHHPQAFASIERAFDPLTNVRYAAAFVGDLSDRTGSWSRAVGVYHSGTPARGDPYREMVLRRHQQQRSASLASEVVAPLTQKR